FQGRFGQGADPTTVAPYKGRGARVPYAGEVGRYRLDLTEGRLDIISRGGGLREVGAVDGYHPQPDEGLFHPHVREVHLPADLPQSLPRAVELGNLPVTVAHTVRRLGAFFCHGCSGLGPWGRIHPKTRRLLFGG